MSIEALTWAFAQEINPASRKFVLVALSNYANEEGHSYPSTETITRLTSLDRKTVIQCLDDLAARHFIIDTGFRKGATKQIKVFKVASPINGVATVRPPENHYVYRLTNESTGEFYIGVRSCCANPVDDHYMGSGRWPKSENLNGVKLKKEILATFSDRAEANVYEAEAIKKVFGTPGCRNESIPNPAPFESIPVLDGKAPNFSVKGSRFFPEGSQKRDTDTSLTVREPKVNPNTRASANGRKPSSIEEVLTKGQFIGLPEQDCRDWFRDCEACNWCRGDGTPFDNWSRQLVIYRDKLAERRSKGGTVNGNGKPASIQDIRTVIQFKEEKARAVKERYSVEGPTSTDWTDPNKKTEYFALRREIKELKAKAERMVMP